MHAESLRGGIFKNMVPFFVIHLDFILINNLSPVTIGYVGQFGCFNICLLAGVIFTQTVINTIQQKSLKHYRQERRTNGA
jgi:hypothetical protein